jgi:hypothetical protein
MAIGFAPIGLRLSEFGPQATGFWRMLFALPVIAAVIYLQGGKLSRPSVFSIVAGIFFGLDIAFWHASLVLTSVANATFIVNLGNASVGIVAWIVLKERPANIWPVAIGVALLGALLLSRGAAGAAAGALTGDLLALLAAVMGACRAAKLDSRTRSSRSRTSCRLCAACPTPSETNQPDHDRPDRRIGPPHPATTTTRRGDRAANSHWRRKCWPSGSLPCRLGPSPGLAQCANNLARSEPRRPAARAQRVARLRQAPQQRPAAR